MTLVFIILAAVCLLLAAAYAFGLMFVRILIRRQDNCPSPETGGKCSHLLAPTGDELWAHNIPYFAPFRDLPFEEVVIRSHDGLRLCADLLRGTDSGVTVIFFHGYKSEPTWDFAAMYDFYRGLGCNLMYVHMRAHGKSDGEYIGFGALDRYDVVRWAEKAAELFPESAVFLHGMSMGAAAVMQSADLDLPKNVRGIIADCGFSDLDTVFRNLIGGIYHLPAVPFVDIFEYTNRVKAGYDFREANSARSLSVAEVPLLYICGESDLYVPKDMALRIYNACRSEKRMLLVPETGHAASYMRAKEEYQSAVTDFIKNYGGTDNGE